MPAASYALRGRVLDHPVAPHVLAGVVPQAAGPLHAGAHPDVTRHPAVPSDDGGRGAVGDGAALQQRQRVGDQRGREHLVGGVVAAVLRPVVVHRVRVVLHRHRGHLLAGGPPVRQPPARRHRVERRHRQPGAPFGVGLLGQDRAAEPRAHLLQPQDEDAFVAAGVHCDDRLVERRCPARAGVLDGDHRRACDAEPVQRALRHTGGAEDAADEDRVHRDACRLGRPRVGVGEGLLQRRPRQRRQRRRALLAEVGGPDAVHPGRHGCATTTGSPTSLTPTSRTRLPTGTPAGSVPAAGRCPGEQAGPVVEVDVGQCVGRRAVAHRDPHHGRGEHGAGGAEVLLGHGAAAHRAGRSRERGRVAAVGAPRAEDGGVVAVRHDLRSGVGHGASPVRLSVPSSLPNYGLATGASTGSRGARRRGRPR